MSEITQDKQNFRNAMAACAAGVHVITTDGTAGRFGITMTAVSSVTDEPPTVMLCINKQSKILPALQENQALCVNVLAANQQDVAEHFAGMTQLTAEERFQYHIWHRGQNGQLQLEGALAHLHGKIAQQWAVGTHQVLLVELDEIAVHDGKTVSEPALVYFRRRFAALD
ncbi:MAG: 4-hydroxyphenylacetate 3-monooxygenase, reductase component [Neisseria sp.]|nr:4-hydroxyphenylacetate 3-monooxygenase, reductase component [Neisseria sp.]